MTIKIAIRDYFIDDSETAALVDLLEFDWPGAVEAMSAMSLHLSDGILRNEYPLIRAIFQTSLAHYEAAIQPNGTRLDDTARLAVFIHHLLHGAYDQMRIKIVSETGAEWTLMNEESFSEWRRQHEGDLYAYRHNADDRQAVVQSLYERVVPGNIKLILERLNYESAVVGRCLDLGDRALPDTGLCPGPVDREGYY